MYLQPYWAPGPRRGGPPYPADRVSFHLITALCLREHSIRLTGEHSNVVTASFFFSFYYTYCLMLLFASLNFKGREASGAFAGRRKEKKKRMDTWGSLCKSQRCSYLGLVMSQICCENMSKEVKIQIISTMYDREREASCPPWSPSAVHSRSTYYRGRRWLCSWRWRIGIGGNQFAAKQERQKRAERRYRGRQVKNAFIKTVTGSCGQARAYLFWKDCMFCQVQVREACTP